MHSFVFTAASVVALLAAMTSQAAASDWPQWRGPFFNGATDEKDLFHRPNTMPRPNTAPPSSDPSQKRGGMPT